MLTNQQIIEQLSSIITNNKRGVLASVISVQGSAYRKEGAKMVIEPDGKWYGMISGGCLEQDVAEEAKRVFETGVPMIKTYELDEDVVWGLGLGCPGTVQILIEPINNTEIFGKWIQSCNDSKVNVFCKIIKDYETNHVTCNQSLLITENDVTSSFLNTDLQKKVIEKAKEKLLTQTPSSECRTYINKQTNEEVHVFFDVHFPQPKLCIFGAGHDAIPLAQFSTQLGFQTMIVDPRPAYNTKERFQTSENILSSPDQYEKLNMIDSRTYIVIMNHHLERDIEALEFSLRSKAPYVGLLGPKKRREKMLSSLEEMKIQLTDNQLSKMHNPIGLNIGADSSEEIALSIMAEIIAFRNGYEGGMLKNSDYIHKKPVMTSRI